ncbi:uncharacterized protein SPSK_01301 [Sporothrix schenckii 1099-18]|uniref:Uncharacterized protein n=1 Tax=Sporothrix schenckii 1099-18 TaxID=1397361 RepID=A0A0F2LY29_SPOSC|nr:uncharacterized protein SPSK_01301 [Sporothrix schenckii 1099-18]KJR81395.1 hypothetical protein SPSK_01301 [Sporothrix schenckii 1099-18]
MKRAVGSFLHYVHLDTIMLVISTLAPLFRTAFAPNDSCVSAPFAVNCTGGAVVHTFGGVPVIGIDSTTVAPRLTEIVAPALLPRTRYSNVTWYVAWFVVPVVCVTMEEPMPSAWRWTQLTPLPWQLRAMEGA